MMLMMLVWLVGSLVRNNFRAASSINAPIGALTDETDVMSEIIGQV